MASNLIVVMGSSLPVTDPATKLMAEYHAQLNALGIPFHVEPLTINSPSDGTMEFVLRHIRKFALQFSDYKKLVVTDAWDFLCYGKEEEILAAIPEDHVLWAAERNCYPEPHLADRIKGDLPWKFVNGGGLAGTPVALIEFAAACERHPEYDPHMIGQAWLNRILAEGWEPLHLDSETTLFYCMYNEHTGNELCNVNGRSYNSVTHNFPSLLHFNGSYSPEPFRKMME